MLLASTFEFEDHPIVCVVTLLNVSVKLPDAMLGLNVSCCTSLVGSREVGDDETDPVTPPASVMLIGATGTFCSAPVKMTWNGPLLAPSTATLPLGAVKLLS